MINPLATLVKIANVFNLRLRQRFSSSQPKGVISYIKPIVPNAAKLNGYAFLLTGKII